MHVTPMFAMAFACFVATIAVLSWILQTGRSDDVISRRFAVILAPHRVTAAAQGPGTLKVRQVAATGLSDRVLRFLGADRAGPRLDPGQIRTVAAATLAVAVLVGWLGTFAVGRIALVVVPVVWVMAARKTFGWFGERHAKKLRSQMPDALAMIVRSVRVGIPVAEGFKAVGIESPEPTGELFRKIASEMAIGVPLEEALRSVTEREGLQEYRFFATALSLQGRTGGGLSETLENLADVIRNRLSASQRGYALAAEARTSALVLACLPVVAIGGLLLLNPHYVLPLFTAPLGHKILGGAVLSEVLGILSMRTLIRKALT